MKKILLIITMLALFIGSAIAQIGEVKIESDQAKIYNENGTYTGNSIFMGSNMKLAGYNSQYIVITVSNSAKIYDSSGNYTGNSIFMLDNAIVKTVTPVKIIIQEGSNIRYYNFKGSIISG